VLQIPNSFTLCLCSEFLMVVTYDICLCSVVEVTVKFLNYIFKICNALIMHEGIIMLNDSVTLHYLLSHFK
jgi:hypothetical protein